MDAGSSAVLVLGAGLQRHDSRRERSRHQRYREFSHETFLPGL
jgi:hypothetical protein